jgi:pantoate--beta-alanine ligase
MRLAQTLVDLEPVHAGVLVPTMGALHEGHLALIHLAAQHAGAMSPRRPVVVSIFVNPTQFDEPDDFERYPHDLDADRRAASSAGADCVFAPPLEVVYPLGAMIPTEPIPAQAIDKGLEDAFRDGHFLGVCQVVRRLFALTRCTAAVFGEKDWQQLQVARAMSVNEKLGVEIIAAPTFRESDGLAMSSRNVHLTPSERDRAVSLSQSLHAARSMPTVGEAESTMKKVMTEAGVEVNYATVRDAVTLDELQRDTKPSDLASPARALVAGRIGLVRLLDNMPWPM